MSLRILLLLAGAAAIAVAFNSERLEAPVATSELGNIPYKYGCKYRVSSVWNDIIFLIDSTSTYGDFAQLFYTMNKIMQPFNITTTGSAKMVRFGFSFYNNVSTFAGQFGQTSKYDMAYVNTIDYYQETDKPGDIDVALQSAHIQFAKAGRPNARKVVVLMTPHANYNSTFAEKLKKKGYVIMVYKLENPAAPSENSTVKLLASPSYATDSITNTVEDLQALQARANCFCDPNYDTFTYDQTTGVPTGGCYGQVKNPVASYPFAQRNCSSNFNGVVALDKSQEKSDFLNKENNCTSTYYIGLKWSDDYLGWLWEDGTMLADSDFNLFQNGRIPSVSGNNKCVYQDKNKNQWTVTACRNALRYVCEFAPCDSTNYYCNGYQ